jgi:hypothetical protein
VSYTREASDRPDHAVAVPRRRVHADVRDFLQGSGCPADDVHEVCDAAGLEVSYRLDVLRANGHMRSGAGRLITDR